MKLPRMTATEQNVFASCYALELERSGVTVDNSAAEGALERALWSVDCFRKALHSRRTR